MPTDSRPHVKFSIFFWLVEGMWKYDIIDVFQITMPKEHRRGTEKRLPGRRGGGEIRKVKKTTDYIFFIFLKNLFSAIPHPSRHAHCRHFDQNMCNACCGF